MTLRTIFIVASALLLLPAFPSDEAQAMLENYLRFDCEPEDDFPDGEPPQVPLRNRDACAEASRFLARVGWTADQFVNGLFLAFTNSQTAAVWSDREARIVSNRAAWKLTEIGRPSVTNFFRGYLERADARPVSPRVLVAMFSRTNLEPEVLGYMRTLCVRTNLYARAEGTVMLDMFDTLDTMPAELKPAATNRVAKYMYFAIRHTTCQMAWQDRELAKFIPAYSNSLQRLSAMQYVEATATNVRQRVRARMEIDRLSALPAGELNDIGWIADE